MMSEVIKSSNTIKDVKLSEIGEQTIGSTVIEIVDSVKDYADYMQEIFDFDLLKNSSFLSFLGLTGSFKGIQNVIGLFP